MANEIEAQSHTIGRYKVFGQAGRDYASASFLAHDTDTQDVVRIKIYRPGYRHDVAFANHFRKDIPRARKPGNEEYMAVPTAWGYGLKIYPYVVFNHLAGKTFADVMAVRDMSVAEMTELAVQASRALAAVHSAGLVVGELTPQKLVITRKDGGIDEVRLVEQGIGRPRLLDDHAVVADREVDTLGVSGGRPSEYAAPEIADPGKEPTARSDVYSLGAVLWELYTGMRFRDAWVAPQTGKNGKPAPNQPTLKLPPKVPSAIGTFLHQTLQPDPARRPADGNEVYELLTAAQSKERSLRSRSPLAVGDKTAPRQSPPKPVVTASRRRWVAPLAALLILTLIGLGLFAASGARFDNPFASLPPGSPAASAVVGLQTTVTLSSPAIVVVPAITATATITPGQSVSGTLVAALPLSPTATAPLPAIAPTIPPTATPISFTLPYTPSGAPAQYAVELNLDLNAETIPVAQVITYTNQQTMPLTALVFRTLPHRLTDTFTLNSLSLNGEQVTHEWVNPVNMSLPVNLAPGAKVVVRMQFTLRLPQAGNYFAFDRANRIVTLGDWLPTIVPYVQDRPEVQPYSRIGDNGIGSPADYYVRVRTASPLLIAASGQQIVREGPVWIFTALGVRDFALTASDQFADPERDEELQRTATDGTVIYGYFLPQHRAKGIQSVALATAAYNWYSGQIGKRGVARFSIAEMADSLTPALAARTLTDTNQAYLADDKEYPDLYFLRAGTVGNGNLSEGSSFWWYSLHGPAYQWFYADVATNQYSDPWLDEATASYATLTYIDTAFGDAAFQRAWLAWGAYTAPPARDPNVRVTPSANSYKPAGASLNAFAGRDDYFTYVYRQGSTFCRQVRAAMNYTQFWQAMAAYHDRNRGKVVDGRTLLATLREFSPVDLNPLFDQFVGYR